MAKKKTENTESVNTSEQNIEIQADETKPEVVNNIMPTLGTDLGIKAPTPPGTSLIGKIISINLKHVNKIGEKTAFFGVGDIWLNASKYWAKIPAGMKPSDYNIIRQNLAQGVIVLGKKFIPPVSREKDTLEAYVKLLNNARITQGALGKDVVATFKQLLERKTVKGWTVSEVVAYCTSKERAGKNRPYVLTFLKELNDMYDGPLTLYEDPSDEEGRKVTIVFGEDKAINTQPANYTEPKRPSSVPGGDLPTSKALSNILD